MAEALICPQCSARLPSSAASGVIRCEYCGSNVTLGDSSDQAAPSHDPLLPDPSLTEVARLFRAGKRVQATIHYREITGATLAEARLALDAFAQGEPLRRPNRMGHN